MPFATALALLQLHERGVRRQCHAVDRHGFDRRAAAARGRGPGRGAHGGDDRAVRRRSDGDDGIAGVDRSLERVRILDRHDIAHLGNVEQRGDAGQQVLAEGGRGREHVGVTVGGNLCDLRRQHLGDGMGVGRVGDGAYARHAGDLRSVRSNGIRRIGQHQHVHGLRADRDGAGHATRGGRVQLAVEVLGDDQDLAHCLSLADWL